MLEYRVWEWGRDAGETKGRKSLVVLSVFYLFTSKLVETLSSSQIISK